MTSLIKYLLGGLALLTFAGVALQALDQFVERIDKENMRQAIVNFWVSIADLNTAEGVGFVLRSRYRQIKRNIPKFLRLFWLMLFMMFIIVCAENHNRDSEELKKDFLFATTFDFSVVANTDYIEAARGLQSFCVSHHAECLRFGDELAWRQEVSRIAQLESSYDLLLSTLQKDMPFLLEIVADVTVAIVIILLSIPLSISL